ncbi:MAG TPA: rod shape-determining protein MreD [Gemmatimonadales bacterium]|nr:rod shape-determining protein MreD [Gemmatimonadales bacterium]
MTYARGARLRFTLVFLLLLGLQFYVRPRLFDARMAPDFLMLGLIFFAIRSRPGDAAILGFLIGLTSDALTPARFGAGALAHTVVGYLAAWGRAVFFADNILVTAGVIALGVWLRNLILLVTAGAGGSLLFEMAVWSPLQALSTAVAGVLLMMIFRDWLAIRLEE